MLALFGVAGIGQTIAPDRFFGVYRQFVWQDQHGLPQNGISSIVQTKDGFLWLAIAEGVVRFDGVNFTAFDTGNTPEIKSNNVQALAVGRDGTLFIGSHGGGVTSYREGRFRNYSTADGLSDLHIRALFEDSRGALWIGTDGGGVNVLKDGVVSVFRTTDGLPDDHVRAFAEDGDGAVWIATASGLASFRDGVFLTSVPEINIGALLVDRSGRLWAGSDAGLTMRDAGGKFVSAGLADGLGEVEIKSLTEDRDGALWIGTGDNGLYRFADGNFENLTTADGLASDDIQAIHADDGGDVWLGTSGGGLAQLHRGRIAVISRSDGLPGDMIGAVFEDSTGAVWIGTDEGLGRYEGGRLTTVGSSDGSVIRGISRISEDSGGRLWLSFKDRDSSAGVATYRKSTGDLELSGNEFAERASVVLHDRRGRFWFGTTFDGVQVVESGKTVKRLKKSDGLADEYVTAIFEDSVGGIWIGTRSGLSRFADGRLETFTAADGFSGRYITTFKEDSRGNFWVGTDGDGLFRFRDGKFRVVTTREGLFDNLAFSILEDDFGNLWMSGNKGIYRASIGELEELINGSRQFVTSFSYGVQDGMLSRECNGATPAGVKSRDGRLWFPTVRGVAVVDPKAIGIAPANVFLDKVFVDDRPTPLADSIELGPSDENLEIRFVATSWSRPAQVRFRYRLAGLDADWVDAGTRRVAYYPHIASGDYKFEVMADNGEGVWTSASQTLHVRVMPPFYLTWWFLLLCSLVIVLLVRLIYVYRVRQLEKINQIRAKFTRQLIDYQEGERKRIAAELHDSIGQNLIVIRNRALMTLGNAAEPAKMVEQLAEISSSAADSIREIRQIAHNLHPYQLEHLGLKTALESMIEQAEETSGIKFEVAIGEVDDLLTKEAEVNFYRIVQESVNNILKHSKATDARVEVVKTAAGIDLTVGDNGCGFATDADERRGLGLAGIAERSRMLDAEFSLNSEPSHGTTLRVKIKTKYE